MVPLLEEPELEEPLEPLGLVVLPEAPLWLGEVLEPLLAGLEVLPEVLLWPDVLPEVPPELLCAPKWASHSERETWPSLFLSTIEKLGVDDDAPAELLVPVLDWPLLDPEAADPLLSALELWPLVLPPEAAEPLDELGVCALVLPLPDMLPDGLLDCAEVEPLDCAEVDPLLALSPAANDAPDSARSAAAVALTRTFTFIWMLLWRDG